MTLSKRLPIFSLSRPAAAVLATATLALAGCALAPPYQPAPVSTPTAFKEAEGWVAAAPADTLERGPWWTLFGDPVLDQLAGAVEVSNQNVAAASAAYAQATAVVRQQRAALFPQASLAAAGSRSDNGVSVGNRVQASIGGSWEPDVWGRLGLALDSAGAQAQASAADLAAARLAAQGTLAANYIALRQTDVQAALLRNAIEGYQRVLQITRNRYAAGIAAKTDVLQAETQLANTQADEVALGRLRAQYEHAIAVLLGKAPAEFSLAQSAWNNTVPALPAVLPSTLLQRRPDIAAAERRMAAANARIGVARSAYFPSFALSASYGSSASAVSNLFSAPSTLWSLGLSAAQTLFDAGAIGAQVDAARAAHRLTEAQYRQTVLSAFQGVEDQLAALQVLAHQLDLQRQASVAADQTEEQQLNRYRAGQINYTDVVFSQVTALNARRAVVQTQAARQTAAIALIQALGGGWQGLTEPGASVMAGQ